MISEDLMKTLKYSLFISFLYFISLIICIPSFKIRSNRCLFMQSNNYKLNQINKDDTIVENINNMRSSNTSVTILKHMDAIQHLIYHANYILPPALHKDIFLHWLKTSSQRKQLIDIEFIARIKLRELKRTHLSIINELESDLLQAKSNYFNSSRYMLIEQLDKEIKGGEQAITSMQKFLMESTTNHNNNSSGSSMNHKLTNISNMNIVNITNNDNCIVINTTTTNNNNTNKLLNQKLPDKLEHVQSLLPIKLDEISTKIALRQQLREETIEYSIYKEKEQKCLVFNQEIGITDVIESVSSSQKYSGHGRNNRGKLFEDTAADIIKEFLIPDVAKKYNARKEDIFAIRNIKLSMASLKGSTAELDCLLCITAERPKRLENLKQKGIFCKVLAVVEIKCNADDIGEAFMGYQSALTWLAGYEESYDPEQWKTRAYATGHFKNRPFIQMKSNDNQKINNNSNNNLQSEELINNKDTDDYDRYNINNNNNNNNDIGYMFTPESFADLKRTIQLLELYKNIIY